MGRTVCFIDKDGLSGTCTVEGLDQYQIDKIMPQGIISCKHCDFCKKYRGKEKKSGFSYTAWTGELG